MRLAEHLDLRPGRGVLLPAEAEAQLLPGGTLSRQVARLCAGVEPALADLLGQRRPPVPARAPGWTLLTEGEHPLWPALALSDPPPLSPAQSRAVADFLAAGPPLPPSGVAPPALRRAAEAGRTGEDGTWGEVLTRQLSTGVSRALLGSWGLLSACVGLAGTRAAQGHLGEALSADPGLCERPKALAEAALWAGLFPLHGGLPTPSRPAMQALAGALRGFEGRAPQPWPEPAELLACLASGLPGWDRPALERAAAELTAGRGASGQDPTVGVRLSGAPGAVAYWLRRRGEVWLLAFPGGEARAWVWQRP